MRRCRIGCVERKLTTAGIPKSATKLENPASSNQDSGIETDHPTRAHRRKLTLLVFASVLIALGLVFWNLKVHAASSGESEIKLLGDWAHAPKRTQQKVRDAIAQSNGPAAEIPNAGFISPDEMPRSRAVINDDGEGGTILNVTYLNRNASEVDVSVEKDGKVHLRVSQSKSTWSWRRWLPAKLTNSYKVDEALRLQPDADPSRMTVQRNGRELTIRIPRMAKPDAAPARPRD